MYGIWGKPILSLRSWEWCIYPRPTAINAFHSPGHSWFRETHRVWGKTMGTLSANPRTSCLRCNFFLLDFHITKWTSGLNGSHPVTTRGEYIWKWSQFREKWPRKHIGKKQAGQYPVNSCIILYLSQPLQDRDVYWIYPLQTEAVSYCFAWSPLRGFLSLAMTS